VAGPGSKGRPTPSGIGRIRSDVTPSKRSISPALKAESVTIAADTAAERKNGACCECRRRGSESG